MKPPIYLRMLGYTPGLLPNPQLAVLEQGVTSIDQARQLIAQNGLDKEVKLKRAKPFIIDELVEKITGSMICLATAQRAAPRTAHAASLQPFASAASAGTNGISSCF